MFANGLNHGFKISIALVIHSLDGLKDFTDYKSRSRALSRSIDWSLSVALT